MLYKLKTYLGYDCNCHFLSNDVEVGAVTGVLTGVGICHLSCLPRAREHTWSLNPERSMDEYLADTAQSLSWPLFQSALGFSLMCSWVKRGIHWASVRRCSQRNSQGKPSFYTFQLTADGVKALGVEIATHSFITIRQKAGISVSVFPIYISHCSPLPVFLAPCLRKGRLQKVCSQPRYPEAKLPGLLSKKL